MPCKKCKDGKYKWGNTGECKYATKDECEKANPKKYSKMKNIPTPLGKKTYEEYEKELKEYNLSLQRVDFKDMKTLAKLLKQADKLGSSYKKLKDNIIDTEKAWEEEKELTKQEKAGYDKSLDDITDVKKQNEKRLEEAAKKSEKAYKIYSNSAKKSEKLKEKFEKENQKGLSQKQEINNFLMEFGGAIEDVEQAGKQLGVDIPVGKFYSAYNKLEGLL